jgi:hypothetical protein
VFEKKLKIGNTHSNYVYCSAWLYFLSILSKKQKIYLSGKTCIQKAHVRIPSRPPPILIEISRGPHQSLRNAEMVKYEPEVVHGPKHPGTQACRGRGGHVARIGLQTSEGSVSFTFQLYPQLPVLKGRRAHIDTIVAKTKILTPPRNLTANVHSQPSELTDWAISSSCSDYFLKTDKTYGRQHSEILGSRGGEYEDDSFGMFSRVVS